MGPYYRQGTMQSNGDSHIKRQHGAFLLRRFIANHRHTPLTTRQRGASTVQGSVNTSWETENGRKPVRQEKVSPRIEAETDFYGIGIHFSIETGGPQG